MNRDKNGEADGMNLEVDSKDELMHIAICDFQGFSSKTIVTYVRISSRRLDGNISTSKHDSY